MPAPAMSAQQLQAANANIRELVLNNSQDMLQSMGSGSYVPASTPTIQYPLRQVGLAKGFVIELTATVTNNGAAPATLTPAGPANLFSNISFFDLDNYQRINTTGWHVAMLNAAKEGFPFGAALLPTAMDSPIGYGNNVNLIEATPSIAEGGGTGTIRMFYYVPLAYGKRDLRGAVYMGVVNATAYLQMTINQTPFVPTGSDATLAIYTGAGAAGSVVLNNVSVNVYQSYLDQLPRYPSGPQANSAILPPLDMSTQYRLINTNLGAISAGQDFQIPFSNFQEFLSLALIADQAGATYPGTDINYFALTAANTLQFFKNDPYVQLLKQRAHIKTDFPDGWYMFSFRDQPISTTQTGNMQLTVNFSTAVAGAQTLVGFESFAMVNTILGAQSLPSS